MTFQEANAKCDAYIANAKAIHDKLKSEMEAFVNEIDASDELSESEKCVIMLTLAMRLSAISR